MSQSCVKDPTLEDAKHSRKTGEKVRQRKRERYQQASQMKVSRRGNLVQAGEFNYRLSKDKKTIWKAIHEQTKEMRDRQDERFRASESLSETEKTLAKSQQAKGSGLQGDIGELEATRIAINILGLKPTGFKRAEGGRGYDGLYRNVHGRLVVIEAKLREDAYGAGSLKRTNHGRQASVESVNHIAKCMQKPGSGYHADSPQNVRLGAEIQRELSKNPANVIRLLVHIHPASLNIVISEGKPDGRWVPYMLLEPDLGK